MWPIRTTSLMRRSCSSSPATRWRSGTCDGHTDGSRRSRFWSASSRAKRSSSEVASVIAAIRRADRRFELFDELRTGLDVGAVEQPGVTGHDPAQPLGGNAVAQQPETAVHPGLAAADDRVVLMVGRPPGQIVGGDHLDPVADRERRPRPHRLDHGQQVGGVDHPPPHGHGVLVPVEGAKRVVAQIAGRREVRQPTGGQQLVAHDLVVVAHDLMAGRQLVETFVRARRVDGVLVAQRAGVHAVVRRRLVQSYERIHRVPVTARLVVLVHEDDASAFGLGQQCVHERHAHGARPDDEVVSFDVHRGPRYGFGCQPNSTARFR